MTIPPGVALEPMRWWHVPACARLDAALFPATAWREEMFWSELAHVAGTRHYLVAVESQSGEPRVVGYAGLAAVPPECDVQTIAVAPDAQGLGLGRALLEALVVEASSRGCTQVLLEVAADNARALDLYRRRGFEPLSTRRDYYGPGSDAVVMRLRIGSAA